MSYYFKKNNKHQYILIFIFILLVFPINASELESSSSYKYYYSTPEDKLLALSGEKAITIERGASCNVPGSCVAEAGTLLYLSGRPKNLWVSTYSGHPICDKVSQEINKPLISISFDQYNSMRAPFYPIETLFHMPGISLLGQGDDKRYALSSFQDRVSNRKLYGLKNANSYIRNIMADIKLKESYVTFNWHIPLIQENSKFNNVAFSIDWTDLSLAKKRLENVDPVYLFNGSEVEFLDLLDRDISEVFSKSTLLAYEKSSNHAIIFEHKIPTKYEINIYSSSNTYFFNHRGNLFLLENMTEGLTGVHTRKGFRFLDLNATDPAIVTPRIVISAIDEAGISVKRQVQCEFISRLSLWNGTVAFRPDDTFLHHLKERSEK